MLKAATGAYNVTPTKALEAKTGIEPLGLSQSPNGGCDGTKRTFGSRKRYAAEITSDLDPAEVGDMSTSSKRNEGLPTDQNQCLDKGDHGIDFGVSWTYSRGTPGTGSRSACTDQKIIKPIL